ncbi:sensor histidine kinase [Planctomycetes bacterium K23_9]|uniref:histidine kinase n=1 Tax=Stieleria marina TaxID=1930275 RepID=A0A517NV98_9BACT|nr:Phytochrome-like protein cph1 [Planctomycetes bacterium K23_9]
MTDDGNNEPGTPNQDISQKLDEMTQVSHQLSDLLSMADTAMILLDSRLCVVEFNAAAKTLFSILPQDRGRPLEHLAHRLDYSQLHDQIKEVAEQRVAHTCDLLDENGRTHQLKLRPADDGGVAVLLQDITEFALTVAELEKTTADLHRRSKLFQDFAYAVSHDLQAPLRHLMQFTSILAEDHQNEINADAKMTLGHIGTSVQRLQSMLAALLDYSRIESQGNVFAKVDLGEVLTEVGEAFQPRLSDMGGELQIGDLPSMKGDRTQLYRLFWHLIDNAIKYCNGKPLIQISVFKSDLHDHLRFQDNGIGIAERHVENVFKMFRRLEAKPEVEGRGEGLALCQRIAERHNASLWCESDGLNGSAFIMRLPHVRKIT